MAREEVTNSTQPDATAGMPDPTFPRPERGEARVGADYPPASAHHPRRSSPGTRRAACDSETVEANARLTGMAGAFLLVLLAAEGLTILRVRSLLTPHVVIGMVLVPVVLLKIGSTTWRFARYYLGDPEYRRKGPPPLLLGLLGPFVVLLTVVVLGTGIALLFSPTAGRSQWLFLHKVTFVLWFGVMTLHVLGHLLDTARLAPRDFYWRTRAQVHGASVRQWLIVGAVVVGGILALAVAPKIGPWRAAGPGSPPGAAQHGSSATPPSSPTVGSSR